MKFYVMTLFPQMILDGLNTSITGRYKGFFQEQAYEG